jgi:hypothetical protein
MEKVDFSDENLLKALEKNENIQNINFDEFDFELMLIVQGKVNTVLGSSLVENV